MSRATAHTANTQQQREYKRLNDLSESQLTTLCAACGWHGGTYWQVVDEIRRLKAIEAKASNTRDALQLAVARSGWHGGTYWQVVDEIRRLKAIEAKASNTRDALQLAVARIEFNARNAFGTAIYDNRPLDEFGPDWKKEDPEEYSEWLLLRTVLNVKETP
jgi:uncharacterized small protein (DUF1192 family)